MLVLFKGIEGKAGTPGGEGGIGGDGGYPGDIQVDCSNQIKTECNKGKKGANGKGGLYGEHGNNGCDIGFTDYQFWNSGIYFGQDHKTKLRVEYFKEDNNAQTRIWCGNKNKWG